MPTIEKAKNHNGKTIFPVTVADAVLMGDGKTLKGELSELGSEVRNLGTSSLDLISDELEESSLTSVTELNDVYLRHDLQILQTLSGYKVRVYEIQGGEALNVKGKIAQPEYFGIIGFSSDLDRTDLYILSPNGLKDIDVNLYAPKNAKYAYITTNFFTLKKLNMKHVLSMEEVQGKINVSEKTIGSQIPTLNFTTIVHDLSDFEFGNEQLGSLYNEKTKEVVLKGDSNNKVSMSKGFNLNHSTDYILIANIYDLKLPNDSTYFNLKYDTVDFGKIRANGLSVLQFRAHYEYKKIVFELYDENGVLYADDLEVSFKCGFIGVIPFDNKIYSFLKKKAVGIDFEKYISPTISLSQINDSDIKLSNLLFNECEKSSLTLVDTISEAYVRHNTQGIQTGFAGHKVNVYDLEGVSAINVRGSIAQPEYFGVVGFSSNLNRTAFCVVSPNGEKSINTNLLVPKGAKYAYITSSILSVSKLTLREIPKKEDIESVNTKIDVLTDNVSKEIYNRNISDTIEGVYVSHAINGLQAAPGGYSVNAYDIEGVDIINVKGDIPLPEYFGVVGFSSDLERTRFEVVNPNGATKADMNICVPNWAKYAYITKPLLTLYNLQQDIPTEQYITDLDNRLLRLISSELYTTAMPTEIDIISDVYLRHDTQSLQTLSGYAVRVYDLQGITAINATASISLPEYFGVVGFSSDLERSRFEVISPNGATKVEMNTLVPNWAKYAYVTVNVTTLKVISLKPIPDIALAERTIIAVGDSITQGQDGVIDPRLSENEISSSNSYSKELTEYLPEGFNVQNYGAGGAKISEIFARIGWLCGITPFEFVLKGDGSKVVIATSENYMVDNYKSQKISYFMQGTTNAFNAIKTAYIRGIECNFYYTNSGELSVSRKEIVDYDLTIKEGTELIFEGAKVNDGIFVVFAGANGQFSDGTDLADSVKHAVQQIENSKYIVIGSHTFSADVLKALRKEFGSRFINLKEYLTSLQSFKDIGYEPLTDDEITETRKSNGVISDIQAIEDGTLPPTYWRYSFTPSAMEKDSVHLSKLGYKATAYIINKRLRELGYVK